MAKHDLKSNVAIRGLMIHTEHELILLFNSPGENVSDEYVSVYYLLSMNALESIAFASGGLCTSP